MIYLIDDNKDNKRIKESGIYFVDNKDFDDILISIERLEVNCNLNFLEDASCILIHKTTDDCNASGEFIINSNTNATKIIEEISVYGKEIPIVIFSNRFDVKAAYSYENDPNCIYKIKKTIFYSRLYDFLVDYRENSKIDFRLLAYGLNYRSIYYEQVGKNILAELIAYSSNEVFKVNMVDINNLQQFFSFLGLEYEFDKFVFDLDNKEITVEKFGLKVAEALESLEIYEEYIYTW